MQGWLNTGRGRRSRSRKEAWRDSVKNVDAPGRFDESLTRDQYIASGDIGIWQVPFAISPTRSMRTCRRNDRAAPVVD